MAARYPLTAGGEARLSYSTPASQVALHVLQLLVIASLPWMRRRRVSEFRVRQAFSHVSRSGRTGAGVPVEDADDTSAADSANGVGR